MNSGGSKTLDPQAALEAYLAEPGEALRDECLQAWLPLVKRVWARLRVGLPPAGEALADDLMQCGAMGLMQALESFRSTGGASFETWARWRIRGAMLDELRRQDWISKERRRRWKALQRAAGELDQRLQRSCSEDELAKHLGLSLEALREELLENAPGSLLFLDREPGLGPALHERLADPRQAGGDALAQRAQLKERLAKAIGALPDQERTLLALLLDQDLGHKEAALVLGLSPGRISQIYAKAVLHLQAALNDYLEEGRHGGKP